MTQPSQSQWQEIFLPITLTREEAEAKAQELAKTHDVYMLRDGKFPEGLGAFPFIPRDSTKCESYLVTFKERSN